MLVLSSLIIILINNFSSITLQGENPIYKQATSTFKNPTYAGK